VSGLRAVLTTLRRKQIPLCSKHHLEFEKGHYSQLDYESLREVMARNNQAFPLPVPTNKDFLPILDGKDFTVEKKK